MFLRLANFMYLTWVDAEVPGETLFPDVRWDEWRIVRETPGRVDPRWPLPHRFVDYERVNPLPPNAPSL